MCVHVEFNSIWSYIWRVFESKIWRKKLKFEAVKLENGNAICVFFWGRFSKTAYSKCLSEVLYNFSPFSRFRIVWFWREQSDLKSWRPQTNVTPQLATFEENEPMSRGDGMLLIKKREFGSLRSEYASTSSWIWFVKTVTLKKERLENKLIASYVLKDWTISMSNSEFCDKNVSCTVTQENDCRWEGVKMVEECLRPYHVENTPSRPIWQVKQRRARLVLGSETAWEHRVL